MLYRMLLAQGELEYELRSLTSDFDHEDVEELRRRGHAARVAVLDMPLPKELRDAITRAYGKIGAERVRIVREAAELQKVDLASV